MRYSALVLIIALCNLNLTAQKYDFRGKLYTDLAGISNDQPNGLIQVNAYLSYTPFSGERIKQDSSKKKASFFRNIVFDLTFSKIEQEEYYLNLRRTQDFDTDNLLIANRLDLYQYANMISTIKINVLTLSFLDIFRIYADGLLSYYRTGIRNTQGSNTELTRNIGSTALGYNIKVNTNAGKESGISFDLSYSNIHPTLFNDRYLEIGGYQAIDSDEFVSQDEIRSKTRPLDIIDAVITINGKGTDKGTNSTKTHLRIGLVGNYFGKQPKFRNSFFIFQLGIDLSIKELLTKKD